MGRGPIARLWQGQNVEAHFRGHKTLHHPEAGALRLDFEVLSLPDVSGLGITTYTAPPGSSTDKGLRRLRETVRNV